MEFMDSVSHRSLQNISKSLSQRMCQLIAFLSQWTSRILFANGVIMFKLLHPVWKFFHNGICTCQFIVIRLFISLPDANLKRENSGSCRLADARSIPLSSSANRDTVGDVVFCGIHCNFLEFYGIY